MFVINITTYIHYISFIIFHVFNCFCAGYLLYEIYIEVCLKRVDQFSQDTYLSRNTPCFKRDQSLPIDKDQKQILCTNIKFMQSVLGFVSKYITIMYYINVLLCGSVALSIYGFDGFSYIYFF